GRDSTSPRTEYSVGRSSPALARRVCTSTSRNRTHSCPACYSSTPPRQPCTAPNIPTSPSQGPPHACAHSTAQESHSPRPSACAQHPPTTSRALRAHSHSCRRQSHADGLHRSF